MCSFFLFRGQRRGINMRGREVGAAEWDGDCEGRAVIVRGVVGRERRERKPATVQDLKHVMSDSTMNQVHDTYNELFGKRKPNAGALV